MAWWQAGLGLSGLLALAAWDVGRPGRATAPALLVLRAVGGLGLIGLAAHAHTAGAPLAALVAVAGAAPLVLGLFPGVVQSRAERARRAAARASPGGRRPPAERASGGRRAA